MKKIIGFFAITFFFYTSMAFAVITGGPSPTVPQDLLSNPTNSVLTYSLNGVWNGSTQQWNREAAASINGLNGNTSPAVMPYIWNGSTFDKWDEGENLGQPLVDSSSNAVTNITTSTTTTVKGTGGILNEMIVNTAGTTWTAAFYNIASGGCTGTPGSGFTFTLQANTAGQVTALNHTFTNGICVVTAGTAGNLSITFR